MITTDKYINLALKRFISHNRLKDNFLDYLLDGQREHVSRIFPTQGLFTYPATLTHPGTSGNSYVDFSPDPITGSDGEGHILSAIGSGVLIDVPFALAANKDYWFALHYVEKPDGIYLNPRTGSPEYDTWEEQLGRSAAPTAVTDLGGGNARFNVNSICASGVDYSGMTVTVWLNNPQDEDETIAVETLTVTYSAPNNLITMTSGDGLGQASISTTLSDYTVCLNGIIWEEVATGAGNPFGSDYTILGYLTTNGVPAVTATYDSAVQNDISGGGGHSLQNAYDFTGSGAGKDILANYQAVEITQENTVFYEDDIIQAALRLSKDGNGAAHANDDKDYEVGLDVTGRSQMYGAALYRARLVDPTGSGELQKDETITFSAAGNTVTFTRGAVDLTLASSSYADIRNNIDLLEISGSTSDDGVYLISAVGGATTVTVVDLDGGPVSFNAAHGGSALGNIYRPVASLGGTVGEMSTGLKVVCLSDFYADATGSQHGGALHITVPTATPATVEPILIEDSAGTDIFKVFADGDVITNGDIDSGKTITGATGLVATSGGVTASAGDITAVAHDIVCTAGDIEVTNAAKNFVYGSARTFYKSYNPYHFTLDSTYASIVTSSPDYINIDADPTGAYFMWLPINEIPHGATITAVDVMMNVAVGGVISFRGDKSTMTWNPSAEAVAAGIWCGATASTVTGSLDMVTKSGLSVSADTSNETYILEFTETSGDPTGTKIYAVRITYTMVNVIP